VKPAIIEKYNGISVVRDDLFEGGSKARFLPFLISGAKEVVYGGPFCGGAAFALSTIGKREGVKITLFYAQRDRARWHRNQVACEHNGARIIQVPAGYMTNVQARAKAYARDAGALFLPLGFDLPIAADPYIEAMQQVRKRLGSPDEVWCATGSGMLARCLGQAFPDSAIFGVAVGLKSRHEAQKFTPNIELLDSNYDFAKPAKTRPPFPSSPEYDAKAWELCLSQHRGSALFWNVL
jgi:hypothetical protein